MEDELMNAIDEDDVERVIALLHEGANVNALDALTAAVALGHVRCVRVLLDAKADVDRGDDEGFTPLADAAIRGHWECVRMLLDAKANAALNTKDNMSPLHFAARAGSAIIVEMLLGAGVEVDTVASNGTTPLCSAIDTSRGNAQVVELLLDAGAKLSSVQMLIPSWVVAIASKRTRCKSATLTLWGVLRKRWHLRVPRDMINMLAREVWATRRDPRWVAEGMSCEKPKLVM